VRARRPRERAASGARSEPPPEELWLQSWSRSEAGDWVPGEPDREIHARIEAHLVREVPTQPATGGLSDVEREALTALGYLEPNADRPGATPGTTP
jgi:hypothetical protein